MSLSVAHSQTNEKMTKRTSISKHRWDSDFPNLYAWIHRKDQNYIYPPTDEQSHNLEYPIGNGKTMMNNEALSLTG